MGHPLLQARLADPSNPVLWTHRLGGLVAMAHVLEERGIDFGTLLDRVGLPRDTFDNPDNRVPFETLPRLLGEAIAVTGCPHLGLYVGEQWPLFDDHGVMAQRARCSSTIGEALESLTLLQRLNSQGGAAYLIRHPSTVTVGFAFFRPKLDELAGAYEVSLSALVAGVREFAQSERWAPTEVLLPRAVPRDDSPYRRFFGCRVRFNAEQACFRFPAELMQRRMPHPDRARARALEDEAFQRLDEHLLPQLYRSLRLLLLDGAVSGENAAQHLSLHRRTLDRRLRALGTTFQAVLDEVRFDVARQLLTDTELPIASIAATVGFSESSSLVRAFRHWAGTTPQRWRASRTAPASQSDPITVDA